MQWCECVNALVSSGEGRPPCSLHCSVNAPMSGVGGEECPMLTAPFSASPQAWDVFNYKLRKHKYPMVTREAKSVTLPNNFTPLLLYNLQETLVSCSQCECLDGNRKSNKSGSTDTCNGHVPPLKLLLMIFPGIWNIKYIPIAYVSHSADHPCNRTARIFCTDHTPVRAERSCAC